MGMDREGQHNTVVNTGAVCKAHEFNNFIPFMGTSPETQIVKCAQKRCSFNSVDCSARNVPEAMIIL